MRPFRVIKDREGRDRREIWSPEVSTFAFQRIRNEVRRELNEADCERAVAAGAGHMIVKGRYGRELATASVPESGGDYQIDPIASRVKHTGLDFKKAVGKRWRAFCSQLQDEEAALTAMNTATEEEADAEGDDAPTALPIQLTPAREFDPPRRGPGRPRGRAVQAV